VSENRVLSFIVKVRSSGVKSMILTIPKEIVDILDLKEKDYVQVSIQKIKQMRAHYTKEE